MSTFYTPSDINPGMRCTTQQKRQGRHKKHMAADLGSRSDRKLISSSFGVYKEDDAGYHFKYVDLKAGPLRVIDGDILKEQLIFKSHDAFLSLQYNLEFVSALIKISKTLTKQDAIVKKLNSQEKIDGIKAIGAQRVEEKLQYLIAHPFETNLNALDGNTQSAKSLPLQDPLSNSLVFVLNRSIQIIKDSQSACAENNIKLPNLAAGQQKLINQAEKLIESVNDCAQEIDSFAKFVQTELNNNHKPTKEL